MQVHQHLVKVIPNHWLLEVIPIWERGPFKHQIRLKDGKCLTPTEPGASTDFTRRGDGRIPHQLSPSEPECRGETMNTTFADQLGFPEAPVLLPDGGFLFVEMNPDRGLDHPLQQGWQVTRAVVAKHRPAERTGAAIATATSGWRRRRCARSSG